MRFAAALLAAAMLTAVPVSAADGLYISAEFDNDAIDYGIVVSVFQYDLNK